MSASKRTHRNQLRYEARAKIPALKRRDGPGCKECKRSDVPLTVDHIVRIADGGQNCIQNMQLLCLDCHKRKDNL